MKVQKLTPQSRPDRKYFWVRFTHPIIKQSVRVNMGDDPVEAGQICHDLNVILNTPLCQSYPDHPANDGLHPDAIRGFFDPVEAHLEEKRAEMYQWAFRTIAAQNDTLLLSLDYFARFKSLIPNGSITRADRPVCIKFLEGPFPRHS